MQVEAEWEKSFRRSVESSSEGSRRARPGPSQADFEIVHGGHTNFDVLCFVFHEQFFAT